MTTRSPILRSLLLAGTLALGAGVVWYMLAGWGIMMVDSLIPIRELDQHILFLSDGTPLVRSQLSNNYTDSTFETLDGQPISPEVMREEQQRFLTGAYFDVPGAGRFGFLPISWWGRIRSTADARIPRTYWYLVHTGKSDGHAYFVGYDSRSKLLAGYLALGGFRPDLPPREEWIPVDGLALGDVGNHSAIDVWMRSGQVPLHDGGTSSPNRFPDWVIHLISNGRLLRVDLDARTLEVILEADDLVAVSRGTRAVGSSSPEEEEEAEGKGEESKSTVLRESVFVRKAGQMVVLDPLETEPRTYTIPKEIGHGQLSFVELAGGQAIYLIRDTTARGIWRKDRLYWADASGEVVRRKTLNLASRGRQIAPELGACSSAITLPGPVPAVIALTIVEPLSLLTWGRETTYKRALARSLTGSWPAFLLVFLVAAVLAWRCRVRQKAHAAGGSVVWIVFVLLFGVPGFLGYLLHRRWPARLPCPACNAPSPRDRDVCAGCDQPFPEPASKGIEVFG